MNRKKLLAGVLAALLLGTGNTPSQAVELNLQNTEIDAAARAMSSVTGKPFIVDPRVKGQITLVTEGVVSREKAMTQFATLLRAQGFAMVEAEGLIKIVPEADAKLQGSSIAVGSAAAGQQIITQVFRLNYESANNMVPILRPLIAANNTINANPGNNTLIITDYAENLRRIGRIIAALDVAQGTDLEVVPIKHAVASDVLSTVSRLLDSAVSPGVAVSVDPGKPVMLADTRTNSILIRAANPARVSLVKQLIAKLDTPSAGNTNVHVVYLKNAEASKLVLVLKGVLSGQSTDVPATQRQPLTGGAAPAAGAQGGTGAFGIATPAPGANFTNPSSGFGNNSNTAGGAGGSVAGVAIQADPSTNSLIITAPEPLYRQVRAVIDQLDTRRAQVSIESMIVEVSNDKVDEIGVQWQNLFGRSGDRTGVAVGTNFGSGGNNLLSLSASAAGGSVVLPTQGINLGLIRNIGGTYVLGALARALETVSGTNVLSMPNLLALDNEQATITVGQNVPFITGQFTNTGGSGSAVNPFQTIERRDVGLTLRVRPQIGEGGSIRLQVYQEVSSVFDRTRPEGIITNKRSIETMVTLEDGATIVLGGLMQDERGDNQDKVPGLGDAPIVGGLFRTEKRTRNKTNLMIFLRPVVLRDGPSGTALANERYDYMRSQFQNNVPEARWWSNQSEGIVLPSLDTKPPVAQMPGAAKPMEKPADNVNPYKKP